MPWRPGSRSRPKIVGAVFDEVERRCLGPGKEKTYWVGFSLVGTRDVLHGLFLLWGGLCVRRPGCFAFRVSFRQKVSGTPSLLAAVPAREKAMAGVILRRRCHGCRGVDRGLKSPPFVDQVATFARFLSWRKSEARRCLFLRQRGRVLWAKGAS